MDYLAMCNQHYLIHMSMNSFVIIELNTCSLYCMSLLAIKVLHVYELVRNVMDVNECDELFNITLKTQI
jgi:hypothetical protein